MNNTYRLKNNIVPVSYTIRIIPIPPFNTFHGTVDIMYKMKGMSNSIKLHLYELKLHTVKILGPTISSEIPCKHFVLDKQTETVQLVFDSNIPTEGVLSIEYEGVIRNTPIGFYKCENDLEPILLTQLEPISARKVFPCFDEPSFKAIFNMEVVTIKGKVCLSNTDIKSVENFSNKYLPQNHSYQLIKFNPTPRMSTYIVSIYIGNLNHVERYEGRVRVRIYTYGQIEHCMLALDTATYALRLMEDFFDVPYPLDKLDLVCSPHFDAGAMENWGLIIFREALLMADNNTGLDDRISIVYTICHELAHQWFGNLVTISWWSELWLNESFATWFGWYIVNKIYPQWDISSRYYEYNYYRAFAADSLQSVHPIKFEANSPGEIMQLFDSITYQKGASVIKMIVDFLSEDTFRKCIIEYVKTYSYRNATTDDLFKCIDFIALMSMSSIITNWITNSNHPVIIVNPFSTDYFEIIQKPFSYLQSDSEDKLWSIPLTNDIVLENKKAIISKKYLSEKINKNSIGFYRVMYDDKILRKLLTHKYSKLSTMDIIGIMSDTYAFLKANMITYSYFLNVYSHLLRPNNSKTILSILSEIVRNFSHICKSNHIKRFHSLVEKYLDSFDFESVCHTIKGKLIELGILVQSKFYLSFAQSEWNKTVTEGMMSEWMPVICHGVENHNGYSIIKKQMNKINESVCLEAMACVPTQAEFISYLDLHKSNVISNQNKTLLFTSAGENKMLNYLLWPYIRDNWHTIYAEFGITQFALINIIMSMKYLTLSKDTRNEIKTFFDNHQISNISAVVNTLIELIEINWNVNLNVSA